MTRRFFLGVDGGNTKTAALLATHAGEIVGRGMAGCSDIYGASSARAALDELEGAITQCCTQAGIGREAIESAVFSMAGADWPEDSDFLVQQIRALGIVAQISVYNDAFGALRAGSPEFTGVAVVCGTGAATGARSSSGEMWHSSWWQDVHGGRQLGQKALRAVYRAELGMGPSTAMKDSLLQVYEVPSVEALLHVSTRRDRIRPFDAEPAGHVLTAQAEFGDQVARQIVDHHGRGLAEYALAAARMVELDREPFTLVLTGGVLLSSPTLQRAIAEGVHSAAPNAHATVATASPVIGALLLAFDQAGLKVGSLNHLV